MQTALSRLFYSGSIADRLAICMSVKMKRYKILPVIATIIIILTVFLLHNIKTNTTSEVVNQSSYTDISDNETSVIDNSSVSTDAANNPSTDDISNETTTHQEETYKPETTIAFTGDILLADNLYANYTAKGVLGFLSESVYQKLIDADLTFINEEFPFSNRGTPEPNKEYTYCVPPERVQIFKDLDIDVVSITNNHILDYGQDALVDTFEVLDNAGLDYVGAGPTLDRAKQLITKEVNGKTIGFLAASRVVPSESWYARNATDTHEARPGVFTTYDDSALCEEITKAKQICDFVVVYAHWGIERQETAAEYQRTMARHFVDAGADLIVGSHPHVMQGVEFYKDTPIVYSLGNFLFSNYYSRTTVLTCTIDKDNNCKIEFLPCGSQTYYTKELNTDEIPGFYDFLNRVSFGVSFAADGSYTYED